jgi:hypothetical protein
MIRRLVSKWPPAAREAFEERLCICMADGIPEYDALMTAFACAGAEMERKR